MIVISNKWILDFSIITEYNLFVLSIEINHVFSHETFIEWMILGNKKKNYKKLFFSCTLFKFVFDVNAYEK